ncbi:Mbeg1-like protein [Parablautia muri]|uniref:DUF2974 domain-containing protein n=1 Tax=Parablautia muri TaxID=2320879 RepID=A0A9X5BH30_9FIRM|nr:Mbeg1-like protein [Parablautia muri]NBJ93583.1 DUF2974 domain-containing protein [Parablautia muri]
MSEKLSDAEMSMVLDTFMYLDYKEAPDGATLNEILLSLKEHPDYGGGGVHYGEYTVVEKAALNETVGNLVISCQSTNMGYDAGTAACTFTSPDQSCIYIAYRGTGDGEWPDNGIGMTSISSTQQESALSYFEEVVEAMELNEHQRLIVTGHSKGGNKAQFVTMESRYHGLIDACYSVDGQGFSEQAIEEWKGRYGEEGYERRRDKLYGLHGENDYVSVLGNSIIPKEHIRYIRTPVEKNNFAGYHDIKYMFAALTYDVGAGGIVTIFNGRKNEDVAGQGALGRYASVLSAGVMDLLPEKRDGCASVIMQIMEASKGEKKGINGEKVTWSDLGDFTFQGLPLIAQSLLQEKEGISFLESFFNKKAALRGLSEPIILQVNSKKLQKQAIEFKTTVVRVKELATEIRDMAEAIPLYMKGSSTLYHRLKLSALEIEKLGEKLRRAAQLKETMAEKYRYWDEQTQIKG